MNWNSIRPLDGSQQEGFEELVCQLARKEKIKNQKEYIRKGKPDAGVECYWILEDSTEIAWQAKYFLASPSANQWGQIDKSVQTVLKKHPNLKTYYIAIPNDPADARIDNEDSMLDKWNDRVEKWKGWAEEKGMDVEFIPWWSSDMIEKLQRSENTGLTYYWFNKEEFTDEWTSRINEQAIKALGKRYTPEVHVELDISKVFDGISRDEHFEKQVLDFLDDLLIQYKKVTHKHKDTEDILKVINDGVSNIRSLYEITNFKGVEYINYESFISQLDSILEASDSLYNHYDDKEKERRASGETHYTRKYGSELSKLRDFDVAVSNMRRFMYRATAKLSNLPALLIEGEAGIGKSHLIADTINKRESEEKGSLLLLGQHFVTDQDPWHQLETKLHLKCSPEEFLGSLNAKAQASGYRFVIFIDAINEGRGRYFWPDNLKAFVHSFTKYEWLGLVLSIRSSYSELITPREEITESDIVRFRHLGFADIEYEASKIFFENYGIELPSIPLLHPEFQNPLFLKLFCEGLHKAGHTRVPDGIQGITSIINFFVDSSNEKLHKPSALDFPKNINVVKKAIEALMTEKLSNNFRYVEYEKAYEICENILRQYSQEKHLLEVLISEGVLTKNCYYIDEGQYEEGIYLTYERFEDHTLVSHLLKEDIDLEDSFGKDGQLHQFIKDGQSCHVNQGIIEALSIQLPEKFSRELYEFTDHLEDDGRYVIASSFLHSLLWRKIDTMHDGLKDYINNVVFKYQGTYEQFLDTMIAVSVIPNHHFNAQALHRFLFSEPMPHRDSWWSFDYLKESMIWSSSVKRLIDWAWNIEDRSHISDESIILASITLSWFLCSPNRKLRDYATKALVSLFQYRLHLVIDLLKKFEGVDDPYIYDRLFAVAYGASLRTENTESLANLSEYIFETIFKDKEEVYPHILLRDYARGVIEYAHYLGKPLSFDITEARPPYKSAFPDEPLSNEEIDKRYEIDYKGEDYKPYHRGQNAILRSMATEYGRDTGGYGDFGRYTFQSALNSWNINYDALSNKAVEWIFEKYGYDVEIHGERDINVEYISRRASTHERIGKKYQWIALYEILARVADNVTEFSNSGYWSKHSELGVYDGPWEPYVRDIDPTILIKKIGRVDEDIFTNFWWTNTKPIETQLTNAEWVVSKDDIPDTSEAICVKDEKGKEWFVLEGYPEWGDKRPLGEEKYDTPHKRMWWQLRSYLVKKEDSEQFFDWTKNKDFWGKWMPESSDRYEMFSRESYWSPAYNFFQQSYYSGELWQTVYDRETGEEISDVMVTTDSYMWEEEFDFSKDNTLRVFKPGQHIFQNMGLKHSQREGEFVDSNGEIICFDPSVNFDSKQFLLVRKEEFLKYLEEQNLRVVWTMIGEKQIIGGRMTERRQEGQSLMEITGSFRIESNTIVGNIDTKLV